MQTNKNNAHKSNRKVFIIGGVIAVLMFAFAFAMVPLYGLICKKTGINTSAAGSDLLSPVSEKTTEPADLTRTVTIQFTTVAHNGMPWDFYPLTKTIKVHPGENNKVFFYARNPTGHTMTAQAIPSMTPAEAYTHFHKIVCFCFNTQTLKAGESRKMPMIFRLDTHLDKEVNVITLAYTLYDTTPKEKTGKTSS